MHTKPSTDMFDNMTSIDALCKFSHVFDSFDSYAVREFPYILQYFVQYMFIPNFFIVNLLDAGSIEINGNTALIITMKSKGRKICFNNI